MSPSSRFAEAIGLVSVIPQACRSGRPSCSRYASDSALGTAEPPHGITRRLDVSRPAELGQHLHPDRRHAGGERHPLLDDQVGQRLAGEIGPGHHEIGTGGDRGVGEAPRVGVEHRDHRQHTVGLAHADAVGEHRPHRVQERAAVAVDHALGVAGGAARVAHARRLVLVGDGELDRRRIGEQRLVVEQLVPGERIGVGHHAGAVVHHHEVAHVFERRQQRRQQARAASGRRRSPRRRRG